MDAWRLQRSRFDTWVGKIPWRRAWKPTPVFLPGESHGQRRLVGYSPKSHKGSDMTEVTYHACTMLTFCFVFLLCVCVCVRACVCCSMISGIRVRLVELKCRFFTLCPVCSVAESCRSGDPMDCSPPGSSVRGILQARILEWVALPSSRGSSPPRG